MSVKKTSHSLGLHHIHIYILYPDGQSVTSYLRVEPFAVLFWALGIVLAHKCNAKGDPARRPGIPQPWYWHSTARQWKVQLDKRHVGPPPFSHLAVLFINAYTLIFIIFIII